MIKIGDRVRLKEDSFDNKAGTEWTVIDISEDLDHINLLKVQRNNKTIDAFDHRFELVKPEPTDEELAKTLRDGLKAFADSKHELVKRGFHVEFSTLTGSCKITKTTTVTL